DAAQRLVAGERAPGVDVRVVVEDAVLVVDVTGGLRAGLALDLVQRLVDEAAAVEAQADLEQPRLDHRPPRRGPVAVVPDRRIPRLADQPRVERTGHRARDLVGASLAGGERVVRADAERAQRRRARTGIEAGGRSEPLAADLLDVLVIPVRHL